jgi:hypothetical protein
MKQVAPVSLAALRFRCRPQFFLDWRIDVANTPKIDSDFIKSFLLDSSSVEGVPSMESADILLIFVATLALLCTAAALPRGLLTLAFFALVATVAVVVLLEVAPTSQTGTSSAVVIDHVKPGIDQGRDAPN